MKLYGAFLVALVAAATLVPGSLLASRRSKLNGVESTRTAEVAPKVAQASNRLAKSYGDLPLSFEPNRGQAGAHVKFISRGTGHSLSLTSAGATLELSKPVSKESPRLSQKDRENRDAGKVTVRMALAGSNPSPKVSGQDLLPGTTSYFNGRDQSKWQTAIPTYARVQYENVYPGIDLVYHGNHRQLEYDFVVAPKADPRKIRLAFEGIDGMNLDANGNLILRAGKHEIPQHRPVVYQDVNGVRREIESGYVLLSKNEVGFELAPYDSGQPLVIDPVLAYSTYYGTTNDDVANGIAVDTAGNTYIIGTTNAGGGNNQIFVSKIAAAGANTLYTVFIYDSHCNSAGNGIAVDAAGNAYLAGLYGGVDQFVLCNNNGAWTAKLNAAGTAFIYNYATGTDDHANAVALDSLGNAYFTGLTNGNWPVTAGAYQTSGGFPGDAFVIKFDPNGNVLYSTYLGGGPNDEGYGIAVDAQKNAVVVGWTTSTLDFPTTANAFQRTAGNSTVTCFVSKLNAAGSGLLYSTYLGGSNAEYCAAVALDSLGKIYATGNTESYNFPVSAGAYDATCGSDGLCNAVYTCDLSGCGYQYAEDAFVTKIDPALSGAASLIYSTFIGAENRELGQGIAVDAAKNAYVTGRTASTFYPTANPIQNTLGGDYDAFLAEVNPTGTGLIFSTYLGGNGYDEGRAITLDSSGNIYLAGQANSTAGFPTKNPLQGTNAGGADAFLMKIGTAAAPAALASVALNPTSVLAGATSTGTVTLTSAAPAGGIIVNLVSNNTAAATVPASVNVAAGSTTGTFTATSKTVAAATTVTISASYSGVTKNATLTVNPAAATLAGLGLAPGTVTSGSNSTGTVTLSGPAPAGNAVVTLVSNNTAAATVPVNVTVLAGNTTATFTATSKTVPAPASVTITATYSGKSLSATLTVNPAATTPAISTLKLVPASVVGGKTSVGTVTLVAAAPASGAKVTLSSNNAIAGVPVSITVAPGATTATFTLTSNPVAVNTVATISATSGGVTKTAKFTVKAPALASLTLKPATVTGGTNSVGTVKLNGTAPAGGVAVTLSSSNTAVATVAVGSVTVPAGSTSTTFTVTTKHVAAATAVTISANRGTVTKNATLTVK
jgi:hypothetical protein